MCRLLDYAKCSMSHHLLNLRSFSRPIFIRFKSCDCGLERQGYIWLILGSAVSDEERGKDDGTERRHPL